MLSISSKDCTISADNKTVTLAMRQKTVVGLTIPRCIFDTSYDSSDDPEACVFEFDTLTEGLARDTQSYEYNVCICTAVYHYFEHISKLIEIETAHKKKIDLQILGLKDD